MSRQLWNAVDEFLIDKLVPTDDALKQALEATRAAGLPMINVAPNQGKLLNFLVRIRQATTILEIGTLGGYSTIWLARALPTGGRLISLEYSPEHAEVARENIERAGLNEIVEIIVGPALESMPKLVENGAGPFDFIFIDADKENYAGYFDWAMKLSQPGTIIVGDNVVRDGELINPDSPDSRVQGVRAFIDAVSRESRVDATGLQTVGVKGYDGLVVAIVNEI